MDSSSGESSSSIIDLCSGFRCSSVPASVTAEKSLFLLTKPKDTQYIQCRYLFSDTHTSTFSLCFGYSVLPTLPIPLLKSTPFSYSQWSPFFSRLLIFLACTPILSLIFLATITYFLLKPYYVSNDYPLSISIALATGCIQLLVGGYGFLHWRARAFRWSSTPAVCFTICLLSMVAFQLSLTYVILGSSEATFVIFLLYNALPLFLNAYWQTWSGPALTFERFLQLKPKDDLYQTKISEQQRQTRRLMVLNVCFSLLILWLYGVSVSSRYNSHFGYQIAAGIMFCDLAGYVLSATYTLSPIYTLVLLFTSRALFFALWEDRWFLALSIQFAIYSCIFIYGVMDQYLPVRNKEEVLDQVIGGLESQVDAQRQMRKNKTTLPFRPDINKLGTSTTKHQSFFSRIRRKKRKKSKLSDNILTIRNSSSQDSTSADVTENGNAVDMEENENENHTTTNSTPIFSPAPSEVPSTVPLIPVTVTKFASSNSIPLPTANPLPPLIPPIKAPRTTCSGFTTRLYKSLDSVLRVGDSIVSRYPFITTPLFSLLFFVSLYSFYTIIALITNLINAGFEDTIFPPIQMINNSHSQYQFGIFFLLLLIDYVVAIYAYRIYIIEGFRFTRTVIITTCIFLIVAIGTTQLLALVTNSDYIFVFSIWLPILLVLATVTFTIWSSVDYRWNTWYINHTMTKGTSAIDPNPSLVHATNINTVSNSGEIAVSNTNQSTLLSPTWPLLALIDFLLLRHRQIDYMLFLGVILMIGNCCALGLHLHYYFSDVAYFIAEAVGIAILSFFLINKWIHTFSIGFTNTCMMLVLLGHSSYLLYQLTGKASICLAFALLPIALVALAMSLYGWIGNDGRITSRETSTLYVSLLCIFAFILAFSIQENAFLVGVLAAGVVVFAIIILTLGILWSVNGYHLPKIYTRIGQGLYISLFIVSIALVIYIELYWVWILAVLFVYVILVMIVLMFQHLRSNKNKNVITNRYIFPVYTYTPTLSSPDIKIDNIGLIAAYTISLILIFWGILAALLFNPSWAGWCVFAVGLLLFSTLTLDSLYSPPLLFATAWSHLQSRPELIDEIRQAAVTSQLKKEDEDGVNFAMENEMDMFNFNEKKRSNFSSPSTPDATPGDTTNNSPTLSPANQLFYSRSVSDSFKGVTHRAMSASAAMTRRREVSGHIQSPGRLQTAHPQSSSPVTHQSPTSSPSTIPISLHTSTPADDYLSYLQRFWRWQAHFSVSSLLMQQRVFQICPHLPSFDSMDPYHRALAISLYHRELDYLINHSFNEEGRIMVTFILLVLVSSESVVSKSRARIRDFLSAYEKAHPDVHIDRMSAKEVLEWSRVHEDELIKEREGYLKETLESMAASAGAQEEDKRKAMQRKNERRAQEMKKQEETASSGGLPISSDIKISIPQDDNINQSNDNQIITKSNYHISRLEADHPLSSLSSLSIKGSSLTQVVKQSREAVTKALNAWKERKDDSEWCDGAFPADENLESLVALDPATMNTTYISSSSTPLHIWTRPSSFLTQTQLIEKDLNPRHILQGDLEDCYLLSALSVLAKDVHKERLKCQMIVREGEENDAGVYGWVFFVDGEWKAVLVDNQFPVRRLVTPTNKRIEEKKGEAEEFNELAASTAATANITLTNEYQSTTPLPESSERVSTPATWVFAHSTHPSELWIPLLEKCYAKLYNGYSSIVGGLVHESFKDLTGGQVSEIDLNRNIGNASSSPSLTDTSIYDGRLWTKLHTYHKQGYLMGVGNPKSTPGQFRVINGIVQGHAYAILDVKENEGIRLIKLRNPWGESQWAGAWAPTSKEWTQKTRKLFDYGGSENTDINSGNNIANNSSNDGVFWMSFDDFVIQFQKVYVCRLFENVLDNLTLNPVIDEWKEIMEETNNKNNNKNNLTINNGTLINRNISTSTLQQPKSNNLRPSNSLFALSLSNAASNVSSSPIWYKQRIQSAWSVAANTAGGCPLFTGSSGLSTCENNPHYLLQFTGNAPVLFFLTLQQPTQIDQNKYVYLSLFVLDKNGLRVKTIKKRELIGGEMKFKNQRETSLEIELLPDKMYTVFLSTFKPGEEAKFELLIYGRSKFQIRELERNVEAV